MYTFMKIMFTQIKQNGNNPPLKSKMERLIVDYFRP